MDREGVPGRGNSMSKGTEAKNTAMFGTMTQTVLMEHNLMGGWSGAVGVGIGAGISPKDP